MNIGSAYPSSGIDGRSVHSTDSNAWAQTVKSCESSCRMS